MSGDRLQKPFLKWVGGKTQILDEILEKIPTEIENYHEPFLGGGSVLLGVLSLQKQGKITIRGEIFACDINTALINVYKHVQNNKDELYSRITHYLTEYNTIQGDVVDRKPTCLEQAKTSKESYYYWLRSKYNNMEKDGVECAALFMFINKTCFRGMYREGPNGYNVPYGHYKNVHTIISQEVLNTVSELIQGVHFRVCGFTESLKNVNEADFLYLDPPYAPENAKSFVGYVADGFNLEMHETLFCEVKKLKNIRFVMSNAKVELVTDSFKNYMCEDITARRAINSKKPESTTTEVIIYN